MLLGQDAVSWRASGTKAGIVGEDSGHKEIETVHSEHRIIDVAAIDATDCRRRLLFFHVQPAASLHDQEPSAADT